MQSSRNPRHRSPVRVFRPPVFRFGPVASELTQAILRSALRAPSGGFAQGWAFLALTEESDRDRFWQAVPNAVEHCPELAPAPLIIVPPAREKSYTDRYTQPDKAAENPDSGPEFAAPYWYIDAGMASLLMLLTAVDRGLDACFFTITPREIPTFRATFAVPEGYDPIGAITVGYRAPDLPPQVGRIAERRLGIEQLVHYGQWDPTLRG